MTPRPGVITSDQQLPVRKTCVRLTGKEGARGGGSDWASVVTGGATPSVSFTDP